MATASINLARQGNVNIKITNLSHSVLLKQTVNNIQAGKNIIVLNRLDKLINGSFMVVAEQDGIIIGHTKLVINR